MDVRQENNPKITKTEVAPSLFHTSPEIERLGLALLNEQRESFGIKPIAVAPNEIEKDDISINVHAVRNQVLELEMD